MIHTPFTALSYPVLPQDGSPVAIRCRDKVGPNGHLGIFPVTLGMLRVATSSKTGDNTDNNI